jgi:dihydroxyacetone kinase
MTQFINKKENIVIESIDGLIQSSDGAVSRLDGYPYIRVVVRNDWDKSKVALVSGGGSGHEPAHIKFVGVGLLTAAVCGDIFASPSIDSVLAGILAVTGPAGCLLIVKNYTGDRLNFGLAAERARTFGLKVNMVIVDDDIALPNLPQSRGIAGTLFVHKIAGSLAEAGASLEDVTKKAKRVIAGTKSIGMSLDTCSVPGSPKQNRIPLGKAELGLGIHGEAGVEQIDYIDAKQALDKVMNKLTPLLDNVDHVVLLNNLGGTSLLEMSVLANELIQSSLAKNFKFIIGPARMMTSLDMHGFSISVYPASNDEIILLQSPCASNAWPGCFEIKPISVIKLPDGLAPIPPIPSKHKPTAEFLTKCCNTFIDSEDDLNALDVKSGDGDTGSTLANSSRAIIEGLDRMPLADHTQLYRAIAHELSHTMGGSLGVLLAIFFSATADATSSGMPMIASFKNGLKRMQQIGGGSLGDRSMLDALIPALDVLENDGLQIAAKAARKGAIHTSKIVHAKVGRASYFNAEQLLGHIDPGAEAVARLFEEISNYLSND